MVTSYRITVGYNSSQNLDEVWNELKAVVSAIRSDTQRIVDEVMRLESDADRAAVADVAKHYRDAESDDLTLVIVEAEQDRRVEQFASGCGTWRDIKESCRRAVGRLVLDEMHRRKMEVNIEVG